MKKLKLFTLACAALFAASCSNDEKIPSQENLESNVTVSINLPATRAAMGDLQGTVTPDDMTAEGAFKKAHIYLLQNTNVFKSVEIAGGSDKWHALTGIGGTKSGLRFFNVPNSVDKVAIVLNPQTDLLLANAQITDLSTVALKPTKTDVFYYAEGTLTASGEDNTESTAVNAETGRFESGTPLKKAELELESKTNRFQVVSAKFKAWLWKSKPMKEEYLQKFKEASAKPENNGKTAEQIADAAGLPYLTKDLEASTSGNFNKYFVLADLKKEAHQGVWMNRFYKDVKRNNQAYESNTLFNLTTFVGNYNRTNGEFTNETALSEVASYFNTKGLFEAYKIDPTNKTAKVPAFNFFADKVDKYADPSNNTAPRINFTFNARENGKPYPFADEADAFKTVSFTNKFVVIRGYAPEEGKTIAANKGGYVINVDIAKMHKGKGILVDKDPTIPVGPDPDGGEDIENNNANVIVSCTVKSWEDVNVIPVL